ncbi:MULTISPECIES: hypothetical protein [Kamptonema]|nr:MULTISPECIES: hypothetical protein [Kamptonema]
MSVNQRKKSVTPPSWRFLYPYYVTLVREKGFRLAIAGFEPFSII